MAESYSLRVDVQIGPWSDALLPHFVGFGFPRRAPPAPNPHRSMRWRRRKPIRSLDHRPADPGPKERWRCPRHQFPPAANTSPCVRRCAPPRSMGILDQIGRRIDGNHPRHGSLLRRLDPRGSSRARGNIDRQTHGGMEGFVAAVDEGRLAQISENARSLPPSRRGGEGAGPSAATKREGDEKKNKDSPAHRSPATRAVRAALSGRGLRVTVPLDCGRQARSLPR